MSQYYGESQWPGAGPAQPNWDHQTPPPPARSGANSVISRDDSSMTSAFVHQLEEVERAIDNLVKSGKMFGPGGRHNRGASGPGPRHAPEFGDPRMGHSGPNLQNFYASQRHQSSRGSNEAEQMMQAKRRMAAQRERELRNYHQEQQYNRNVLADVSYNAKSERALSPGGMSDDDRRELIARQRSALYGEGHFEDAGAGRAGIQGLPTGPSGHRGPSPLAYEYGRSGGPAVAEGVHAGELQRQSRANSNASPQSNPPTNTNVFESATGQQVSRTSNSSPTGGSPPHTGGASRNSQTGNAVAPIGTRPSANAQPANPALNKRSTTPLPSPLSHGFSASGTGDENSQGVSTSGAPSNPPSAAADGYNGWGSRSGVWGNKSGLSVQASVWG
ncbi:hypothetical protein F4778DRAFT_392863 [Xylariomycetidae sp. FL2044]|nr:hypothetical protein F4778DRAFT_392863 [Xylariomycetidae sp. FL2044]